jgi:hypothetical protein
MRQRPYWIIAAALLVMAVILIPLLLHIGVRVDFPPSAGVAGGPQMPWTPGLIVWVVAWTVAAVVGMATICVFAFRLIRRLLGYRPLP